MNYEYFNKKKSKIFDTNSSPKRLFTMLKSPTA